MTVHLTLYSVRNRHGQYLAKSNREGLSWVRDLENARIYVKPGPARSQVTWYANHDPKGGIPDLIELRVTEVVAVNEARRVQASISRKEKAKAERDKESAEFLKRQAEIKLKEAQDTLDELKRRGL